MNRTTKASSLSYRLRSRIPILKMNPGIRRKPIRVKRYPAPANSLADRSPSRIPMPVVHSGNPRKAYSWAKRYRTTKRKTHPASTSEPIERRELIVSIESGQVPKDIKKATEDVASSVPRVGIKSNDVWIAVLTCAICLGQISMRSKPLITHCGHVFCTECLTHALKNRARCPLCRTPTLLLACSRVYMFYSGFDC